MCQAEQVLPRVEAALSRRRLRRSNTLDGPLPDAARPRGKDGLPKIKHIVILMMENHSYDNYFGMLSGRGDGFTVGADGQPTETNRGGDGSVVHLTHFAGTRQVGGVPTQAWSASHIQWDGGSCDGFVRSVEETLPGKDATVPMRYWTEADLPFYHGLARTFPLATRWFCSCLGPTFPNRRFMIAGTSHGLIDDLPFGMVDRPAAGTLFHLLNAHRISWANYHNVPAWQINLKRIFQAGGVNVIRSVGIALAGLFPSVRQAVESKVQATAELYPLGTLGSINHLRTMPQLFADIRSGRLPSVSIVDPDYGLWSEENPQDIAHGEAFAAKVINAVMAGPGWPETLLIWLYDEHGGYYDHVPPPEATPPDDVPGESTLRRIWYIGLLFRLPFLARYAREIATIDDGPTTFDRLGFRVPAVIVSPYARPDFVTDTVYDHTSILKLIECKWNLPPLTRRDAAATDPLDALDFDRPPAFLVPPTLPPPAGTVNL
jgi:phospholipase C